MKRKGTLAMSFLLSFLLVLASPFYTAAAQSPPGSGHTGKSCPHSEVKEVQGSEITLLEDSFDFGQIPVNRKVTHIFHFKNTGTAPLLLAQHVKSKPIEGC
jgi:hypothetical protein